MNLSEKQFEIKFSDLISNIQMKAKPFPNDTPAKKRARKEKALSNYFYFKKTYFPHYADKPDGFFHRELDRLESNGTGKITGIAGPRSHGKTVDLGIIKPLWRSLRRELFFFIAIGANEDLSTERTASIKIEMMHNQRLINDFGMLSQNGHGEDSDFISRNGTRWLALGYGQPVRGKIFGSKRPDYILIDDFEDSKSTSKDMAEKKLSYIRGDAYGAGPDAGLLGKVIWLGNNTTADSAFNYLKTAYEESKSNNLVFRTYKAIMDNGKPLWPEAYTIDKLLQIKSAMGELEWERHMQQNPVILGKVFKKDWFRYYKELPKKFDAIVTYTDPAFGESKKSDFRAQMTIGLANGKYYLVDPWLRRSTIDVMLERMYMSHQSYQKSGIIVRYYMEANMWQALLWRFLKPLSAKYGYILPVQKIHNMVKKEIRIEQLQPLFEWGWILFPEERTPDLIELEKQFLVFPNNKAHDDGPDCFAEAVDILSKKNLDQDAKSNMSESLMSSKLKRMP